MADAPVVDGTLLEAAKENIRPLASGRRATALAGALAAPHAQRDAEHARFRAAISAALESPDADALGAYAAYVDWTVETYPAGHASLVPLLEEATRALRGRYAQDARYVRLWAAYAALVARPEVVWRFALANELGTSWAALYEALAGVLERAGRMQDADETFRLGIARGAAPLERLQAKHTAFQKRMMAGALAPAASASSTTPAAAPTAAPKRRILGDSSKKSSTSTPAPLSAQPAPTPRANAQIAVFVDGDEPESTLATNAWPELGTRTARVKENVRAPGPMAGATLKQRRAPASARAGGFAVFTGPEDEPSPAPVRKVAEPARKGTKAAKTAEAFVPFTEDVVAAEAFVPFVDDDGSDTAFVPFCDEGEDEEPAPARTSALGSVMQPKAAAADRALESEAEALRKNPLKNYPGQE